MKLNVYIVYVFWAQNLLINKQTEKYEFCSEKPEHRSTASDRQSGVNTNNTLKAQNI